MLKHEGYMVIFVNLVSLLFVTFAELCFCSF